MVSGSDRTEADRAIDVVVGLISAGRPDQAATRARDERIRHPRSSELARLAGIAALQLGRVDEARRCLEEALALAPRSVEVLCNLGSVLLAGGDADAAVAILEKAVGIAPGHPAVLNGLGTARRAAGDAKGARAAYAAATSAAPELAASSLNLAAMELELGATATAERAVRDALSRTPDHPEALFLLGHVLAAQHRYEEAGFAYAAAATAAPRDARFAYQVGLMAEARGHLRDAANAYQRALTLDPDMHAALGQLVFLKRRLCDWDALDLWSARLRASVAAGAAGIAPFGFLAEPASAAEQLRCARNAVAGIQHVPAPAGRPIAGQVRLKVGLLSNGLGNHPTGALIVAMVEALGAHSIDLTLFSTSADDGGPIAVRLRRAANWQDVAALARRSLAQRISESRVDVLLDVRDGHEGHANDALTLRPAPLQVAWLAYPGTLGAPWIDYVIADRVVLPAAMRAMFSETVAWLPRCYQPSDCSRVVATPPSRRDCGLPALGVVYACFNNRYKINPNSFGRMLDVLQSVPDSVLWLLGEHEGADERMRAYANARGVDTTRLVFMPRLPHADYLARYRHVDLFLDTTPYNAHTTASDAIWAGCPVLTVAGDTFASRVATSLNHHLGMPQLIAHDDAAFVAEAVRLGHDAGARMDLHAELARRRESSGLFDMQGYARDMAALLHRLSRRQRAGLPPAPVDEE